MEIRVKFLEGIRDKTGEKEINIDFPEKQTMSLRSLMIFLLEKYGQSFVEIVFWKQSDEQIRSLMNHESDLSIKHVKYIINGNIINYTPSYMIKDGDVVVLFLPLAGG